MRTHFFWGGGLSFFNANRDVLVQWTRVLLNERNYAGKTSAAAFSRWGAESEWSSSSIMSRIVNVSENDSLVLTAGATALPPVIEKVWGEKEKRNYKVSLKKEKQNLNQSVCVCFFHKVFQEFFFFFYAVPLQESTCISMEGATSVILPVRSAPVQRKRTAPAALNTGENLWNTRTCDLQPQWLCSPSPHDTVDSCCVGHKVTEHWFIHTC